MKKIVYEDIRLFIFLFLFIGGLIFFLTMMNIYLEYEKGLFYDKVDMACREKGFISGYTDHKNDFCITIEGYYVPVTIECIDVDVFTCNKFVVYNLEREDEK